MKRITSTTLLLALLTSLIACGGEPTSTETTTAAPTDTTAAEAVDPFDALEAIDYGGREFCFVGRLQYEDELCVDEETGDVLSDTVYARNRAVEEKFNVEFTWNIGEGEYSDLGKNEILAGDDTYDVLEIHSRMAFNFMIQDLLHDWNVGMPHVNLDADWWSQDMRKNIAVGNKIYFMSGDISYYFLADTQVTLFNKSIAEDYDIPSLYDTVRAGDWTFEYMAKLASDVTTDLNGDNEINVDDDRIGYITSRWRGPNFCYIAQGTRLIEVDNSGTPVLALNNDRADAIYTRYFEFLRSDAAHSDTQVEDATMLGRFMKGNILFFDGLLKYTTNLRDMNDDFGILPMPKFDKAQENYLTTPGAGINFYAVPVTVKDSECASMILEALAILGHRDVIPEYYNTVLKSKYARDNESSEMLDLIRENIIIDLGAQIYAHGDNKLNSIGFFLDEDETLNFASFYAANVDIFKAKLDEVVEYVS